jgi:hypothetical protein
LNLRPLGYEQYDEHLCRLSPSPITVVTSAGAVAWSMSSLGVSPSRPIALRLVRKSVHKYRALTCVLPTLSTRPLNALSLYGGPVIDGTTFYDSIAFNELWENVTP